MIRSSKHTIKFANKGKKEQFSSMMASYRELLVSYIFLMKSGKMLYNKYVAGFLPNSDKISHCAWKQVAAKQASSLVRAGISYQKKRCYNRYRKIYRKCIAEGIHPSLFVTKRKPYPLGYGRNFCHIPYQYLLNVPPSQLN